MINGRNYIKGLSAAVVKAGAGAVALLAAALLAGCYIPGLGAAGTASNQPANGDPGGVSDTFYGKFMIYEVGGGKVGRLGGGVIDYILGDTYFPTGDPNGNEDDYNILHKGDGTDNPGQTIRYRDVSTNFPIVPSSRPEAIITPPGMALYYNNHTFGIPNLNSTETNCGLLDWPDELPETVPPPAGEYQYVSPGFFRHAIFNDQVGVPDIDVFTIDVETADPGHAFITPGTLLVFRLQFQIMTGRHTIVTAPAFDVLRQPKMSLFYSADGGATATPVLAPNGEPIQSRNSNDYWRFEDAMITYSFQNTGLYFLKVEDLKDVPCSGNHDTEDYTLHIESPSAFLNKNRIMKGEIQPARSGNPSHNPIYNGGYSFEPDDLSTKVQDLFPVCDAIPGVPGSGGAGDAGLNEQCNGYDNYGAHDGVMEYQEVDNKAAIDDGEYFVGKPTNLGTTMDAEVSLVKTPMADTLTMFVSFGNRIYMLESLDGMVGLQWDLTNLVNDKPAVVPRQQRLNPSGQPVGSPVSPVVSSGPLGFCDTAPGPGDVWAAPELQTYAAHGGTVATGSGTAIRGPSGFPNTVGVSFGSNKHLDSIALQDTYDGNTITSGPDGIINTFFAPQYVVYGDVANPISNMSPTVVHVTPADSQGMHGPGNSDNPTLFDSSVGAPPGSWTNPLAAFGGDNRKAFLFGDDEWNPAIFTEGNTTTPAGYMTRQHCDFYNFGTMFDRCAMGVPVDQNGQEPVAIQPGGDNRLNTVDDILWSYHGDDRLCHFGAGDSVAICPGPDGKFGVPDIYNAIKGDDVLEVVQNPHEFVAGYLPDINGVGIKWNLLPALAGFLPGLSTGPDLVIGIAPGPNGKLDTPLLDSYTVVDLIDNKAIVGGDHYCQTLDGHTAICPGLEVDVNLYDLFNPFSLGESRRLVSVWSMYLNSPEPLTNPINPPPPGSYLTDWRQMKQDDYGVYDDNFCIVDGKPAICPGANGYFQSYPLSQRVVVAWNDDISALYQDVADLVGQPCFLLVGEKIQKTPQVDPTTRFFFYRYYGVRGDDQVRWDPVKGGYHVKTGPNGINQSCVAPMDVAMLGFNRGLPYQPIITAGADGVLETYPLQDFAVQPGPNLHKISTGPDGVANSFVMGDDRAEIFFGTGAPDHACVLAGPDGISGTTAQDHRVDNTAPLSANDTQLYDPGAITGFDALQVWAPDAVVMGYNIYLYYTALGFETLPPSNRPDSGSLADLGECKRPGLDKEWGKNLRDTKWAVIDNANHGNFLYAFNNFLAEDEFPLAVDNNEGVELAPRIGVATSDIFRLRNNPSDWTFYDQPAFDLGQVCSGKLDFPIDLGDLALPPLLPDTNWDGAYSPDMIVGKAPDGESPIFLMFFTGRSSGEEPDDISIPSNQIGLARSLDGFRFEFIRQAHPLMAKPELDLSFLLGTDLNYAYPTIAPAGNDEWGEPMYGMFYNEFKHKFGKNDQGADNNEFDMIKENHIGYAMRRGKVTLGCNLGAPAEPSGQNHPRLPLQIAIIAVPLLIILTVRVFRRRKA